MEELFCFYAEEFKAKRKGAKFWMLFRFVFIFDVQNNNKYVKVKMKWSENEKEDFH